jgi:predicted acyltransferase
MVFLCLQILHLPLGTKAFPDSTFWQVVSEQTSHAAWRGLTAWDLIQPLFMFMVGISLPWSVAARRAAGQSAAAMWKHTLWRSLVFVVLGILLVSLGSERTQFDFTNVLTQIGLGYPLLFGLAMTRLRTQVLASVVILVVTGISYALTPDGWEKNRGPGAVFDLWFLNLFPSAQPFTGDPGGYATLNFIPATVTMLAGVMAGQLLHQTTNGADTLRRLLLVSLVLLVVGLLLDLTGIAPLIKRIWTPSFVLLTGGIMGGLLAFTYWLVDVRGISRPFVLLRIVGMNSLILYIVLFLWDPFLPDLVLTHLGWNVLALLPEKVALFTARAAGFGLLMLFCIWLHQHRVYIKV